MSVTRTVTGQLFIRAECFYNSASDDSGRPGDDFVVGEEGFPSLEWLFTNDPDNPAGVQVDLSAHGKLHVGSASTQYIDLSDPVTVFDCDDDTVIGSVVVAIFAVKNPDGVEYVAIGKDADGLDTSLLALGAKEAPVHVPRFYIYCEPDNPDDVDVDNAYRIKVHNPGGVALDVYWWLGVRKAA